MYSRIRRTGVLWALTLAAIGAAYPLRAAPPDVYLVDVRSNPTTPAADQLILVDPAVPANPWVLEAALPDAPFIRTVIHGTVPSAAAPRSFADEHLRTLVYVRGNRIVKVSLLRTGTPFLVQVSSEANANQICSIHATVEDFANHDNAAIVYSLRGPDTSCATEVDNTYHMVRLGMSAVDNPLPAKRPIASLHDNNHARVGWLGIDGNQINRYDANFGSPQAAASFTGSINGIGAMGTDIANATTLLKIKTELRAYKHASRQIGTPLHTFSDGERAPLVFDRDEIHTYFADDAALLPTAVHRVPSDGSGAAELVISEAASAISIRDAKLTDNRLVYILGPNDSVTARSLKSIPKAGGTAAVLAGNFAAGSEDAAGFQAAAGTVYYDADLGNQVLGAMRIAEDGTGGAQQVALGRWSGALYSPNGDRSRADPTRLILLQGSDQTSDGSATVTSFDTATNGILGSLGTLPAAPGISTSRYSASEATPADMRTRPQRPSSRDPSLERSRQPPTIWMPQSPRASFGR